MPSFYSLLIPELLFITLSYLLPEDMNSLFSTSKLVKRESGKVGHQVVLNRWKRYWKSVFIHLEPEKVLSFSTKWLEGVYVMSTDDDFLEFENGQQFRFCLDIETYERCHNRRHRSYAVLTKFVRSLFNLQTEQAPSNSYHYFYVESSPECIERIDVMLRLPNFRNAEFYFSKDQLVYIPFPYR